MGAVYRHLGHNEDAIHVHEKATKLDPQNSDAWNSLGYTYLVLGNLPEAEKALAKAVDYAKPNDYSAAVHKGILHYRQGEESKGHHMFEDSLIRCWDEDLHAQLSRAWLRVVMGQTAAGLAELQTMLAEMSPSPQLLNGFIQDTDLLADAPESPSGLSEMRDLLKQTKVAWESRP
jgi:tetratricopeptide (TPR) repeat protein